MALAPSAATRDEAQALQLAEQVGARWGHGSLSEPCLRPHTGPQVPAPRRFCSWDGPRLHFSTSLLGASSVNWGVWFLLLGPTNGLAHRRQHPSLLPLPPPPNIQALE